MVRHPLQRGVRENQVVLAAQVLDTARLKAQSRPFVPVGAGEHFRGAVQPGHVAVRQMAGEVRGEFAAAAAEVDHAQLWANGHERQQVVKRGGPLLAEAGVGFGVPGHAASVRLPSPRSSLLLW